MVRLSGSLFLRRALAALRAIFCRDVLRRNQSPEAPFNPRYRQRRYLIGLMHSKSRLCSSVPGLFLPSPLRRKACSKRLALMKRDTQAYDATIAGIFIVLMLILTALVFVLS